jgi:DNA topoisomerase-1
MEKIRAKREKRENVLAETIRILKPILEELKEKEKSIGERLSNAVSRASLEKRTVGSCPICKTGKLMVLHSRKTGKRFVGCTSYFEDLCSASFPLPQKGSVKPIGRNCQRCGWPTVQVRTRGRSWTLCLNPECPSKKGKKETN